MLESDAPTGDTTPADNPPEDTPPAAPRRRRAASRPAGPPAPVMPPVQHSALPPAPEAVGEIAPASVADVVVEADVVEVDESVVEPEPAEEAIVEEAPAEPNQDEEPVADEPVAEEPTSVEPTSPEPADEPRAPRRRRRGAATAASDEDELAGSLADLAERARVRTDAEASGERVADVTAALDSLAAAIGGDDETADEAEDADDADGDADDDSTPRRRRRRRGGRRRRRASSEDADEAEDADSVSGQTDGDTDDTDTDAAADRGTGEDAEDDDAAAEPEGEGEATSGSGRRRRRRRRRGEDTGDVPEEGVDVVVKVREPRRAASSADQITGIEGSTRMEAKKQRRREGRAAGRRRAPVLSEAEFLARREAVERMMLIRQADDYTQIAVLEDGILVEHYVDRDSSASLIGNVYLGRVQNVLPSMEAAFVDIGRGRNAVLYAGEVDWDSYGVTGEDRRVEKVLKSGSPVLVQVTKDPIGAKGARLTSHISIPGRYVVFSPGGQLSGISRKLPEAERNRLKTILDAAVGEEASVIVRTAAEGASEEDLLHDVARLKAQWEVIDKKVKSGSAPQALYAEPDLTVRIVRDLFTEDFSTLVVDGNGVGEDAYDTVQAYVTHVAPHLQERLRHWDRAAEGDLFEKFRVHEQVAKALERKVHLPSGGSLIVDRTEAMTVIDVNTGKFTGTQGNLEATVTSNNLEAAEEIVRQLRLRDIGGIIVIDFIDMVLPANRELLLRRLVECLSRDRTRHQVAEVTSLGLVQMTRKRIGTGLAEAFSVPCETCAGRGYHIHDAPVATQAPSDGGDRDSGRRSTGNRRGGGGRGRRQAEPQQSSPEPAAEPVAIPEPVGAEGAPA